MLQRLFTNGELNFGKNASLKARLKELETENAWLKRCMPNSGLRLMLLMKKWQKMIKPFHFKRWLSIWFKS